MRLFRSHLFRYRFIAGLFLVMASGLFAVMAAPYLPRLVMEGFPRAKWPAPGSFAALDGEKQALPVGPVGSLNDWSEELFTGSDGRALLIYRKGTVELAHYADDVRPEIRLNSYSMVKSLVGALLLKAIAEGRISSLDDPVGQYLPDVGDAVFRAVPLHAFATMRSGVGAETGVGDPVSPQESRSVDRIASGLFSPIARLHMGGLNAVSGELSSDPDARGTYSYQNVNTAVISGVLSAVYGKPLETILNEKIWAPSGAGKAEWRRYHSDLGVTAYCCIYATPSDWLRVGVFLMKNGDQDRPFLPHTLWQTYFGGSISKQARHAGRYGMHVFHNVLDRKGQPLQGPFSFMAGTGGQRVYMMPEADLVVVRFGAKRQLLHSTLYAAWQLIEE